MNSPTYIFIGRSGCGKGTQALLLKKYLGTKGQEVFYLESGAKFRDFVSQSGYTAQLSNTIMKKGELQPAFLAIHIWSHLMIEQMDEKKHLMIDGTPRKLAEAKILDEAFKFYGRKDMKIIYVNVSDAWSIARLEGRGRADDKSLAEVKKRLAWFNTDVIPALDFYKNNSDYDYLDINGEQTIEQVQAEILTKLGFK
ncbi:MAG TPA: nucleoside monophosphate kinase [Candidatus Paceibacterota bacterium]